MSIFKTPKGTELPLLDLRGKPYLQVAHRLVWMREEHSDWQIKTAVTYDLEKRWAIGHATITDGSGRALATAHKFEDAKGFQDYIEKSETGAIGRALALCGYGTQFAPEFDEAERVVDSPVVNKPSKTEKHSDGRTEILNRISSLKGALEEKIKRPLGELILERYKVKTSKDLSLDQVKDLENFIINTLN